MSAPYLPAFGGVPLVGDRLVRLVYMDEAGISQHEPHYGGLWCHCPRR